MLTRTMTSSKGPGRPGLHARVLEAYGGADRWRAATRVEAVVSSRGLLFRAKRQRPFVGMPCSFDVHAPRARLAPREWDGDTGVLDGPDVRIEGSGGDVVEARADARRSFRGHVFLAHEQWDGLPYPSHRRVTPRLPGAYPLPGPVLVEILVHEWRLV